MTQQQKIFYKCMIFFTLIFLILAWLGGYDFNHREPRVAIFVTIAIVCSMVVSKSISEIQTEED